MYWYFSFIGYNAQEITVGKYNHYMMSLVPEITSLESVVVMGYSTKKTK